MKTLDLCVILGYDNLDGYCLEQSDAFLASYAFDNKQPDCPLKIICEIMDFHIEHDIPHCPHCRVRS
jgi:hypothetical protein